MLYLVRHGRTEANAAGLLLGRMESLLTEDGRATVSAMRSLLGTPVRLVSSPLGRARESAAALGTDLPVELDDRWVELDYGEYDGRRLTDVPAEVWARWRADADFRPPGGETLRELGRRVRAACDELFAPGPDSARAADVVVVSHVSPIKAAVAWALGADDAVTWRLYLATASVTAIGWGPGGAVLQCYNRTL